MTRDASRNSPDVVVDLPQESDTDALGQRLAGAIRGLSGGLNVYLHGDLGAGKTCLVRAILRSLGIKGPIKSPTYTLVESYVAALPQRLELTQNLSLYCYHFDFYRFDDPREWLEAGFRDYFDAGALCLVEWPERALGAGHLPTADLDVHFEIPEDPASGRRVRIHAGTKRGQSCLDASSLARRCASPPAPPP